MRLCRSDLRAHWQTAVENSCAQSAVLKSIDSTQRAKRGSKRNAEGLPITSLGEFGWRGLRRKLCSAGRIALGTCNTAEVPLVTQASPTSRTFMDGGSALQFLGRSGSSTLATTQKQAFAHQLRQAALDVHRRRKDVGAGPAHAKLPRREAGGRRRDWPNKMFPAFHKISFQLSVVSSQ